MKELRNPFFPPAFYLTPPAPCPYLEGRVERKIFTHLNGTFAPYLNDALTNAGFRRSQNIIYKPHCEACSACVSVRVRVNEFQTSASFRRIRRKNADITSARQKAQSTQAQFRLLSKYLAARHNRGGMADMNLFEFMAMIEESHIDTHLVEYTMADDNLADNTLAGFCLTDRLADGLSMVYSCFDPDLRGRSLGSFMILDHIERTKAAGLDYLYLGYWIEDCRKMMYKDRFQPLEQLTDTGWALFPADGGENNSGNSAENNADSHVKNNEDNNVKNSDDNSKDANADNKIEKGHPHV